MTTPPTTQELMDAALDYAARKWYGIPLHDVTQGYCSCGNPQCKKPGKHPRIADWANAASIDPAQIHQWWMQWPYANVGILTGERSGLGVLDVDPRNGGDLALEDLVHAYGPLPATPMVISGGKGPHHYFALDGPLRKFDPGPGLNLQADGALIVAPPSLHYSGNTYEWEASSHPDDVPLAPLSDWLRAMGATRDNTPVAGVDLPDTLPDVNLPDLKVSPRIMSLIQTGEDPDTPTRYCYPNGTPDRSRALFAVIQALLGAGHDDATIAGVVMDKRYGISDKVLSQQNARNPHYWDHTKTWVAREIARAKAKHQSPPHITVTNSGQTSTTGAAASTPGPSSPGPSQGQSAASAGAPQGAPPGQKLSIHITADLPFVVKSLEAALQRLRPDPWHLPGAQPDTPVLFQRARRLCVIARGVRPPKWLRRPQDLPVILNVSQARLLELAAQAAEWQVYDQRSKAWKAALPPEWAIKVLLSRGEWAFAPLEGLIHAPTLRPDGSVLDTPGYDSDTGLYLDTSGIVFPPLKLHPSVDDARAAIGQLQEPLLDFPFMQPWHRSTALAATLSLVCRFTIQGNVPLFAVSSTVRASGKGLLIDVISIIATGRQAPRWAQTRDEEEERKRLLTLGLDGIALVHIDNVLYPLGSAPLDLALTAPTFSDRLLGKNVSLEVPMHAVFFASGNNLQFQGDTARRSVPIVIDPGMEKPEERTNFRIKELVPWMQQTWPRLTIAALTILKAYFAAGCPAQGITPLGSFEEWSAFVRQALMWAGEADPCEGRKDLEAESDPQYERLTTLLACWEACYPNPHTGVTLNRVVQDIGLYAAPPRNPTNKWNELRDALGAYDGLYNGERLSTQILGKVLRSIQGRVVNRKRFKKDGTYKGVAQWVVETV